MAFALSSRNSQSIESEQEEGKLTQLSQYPYSNTFDLANQGFRLLGAVATLGSGCSLGPEGPSVEIGAGSSRVVSAVSNAMNSFLQHLRVKSSAEGLDLPARRLSSKEQQHLFLAGTAAGVAAGFSCPIAGIFFALECGNRYLLKNLKFVQPDANSIDGPRADIAAIVVAAAFANIIVSLGLRGESSLLSIQGNSYAMISPFFELPLYMLLGLICGAISVLFTKLRDLFTELFSSPDSALSRLPRHFHPIFGGLLCGVIAVFFPQTLFVGYVTLDQLLAGKIQFPLPLLLQLLCSKLILSAFSLGSGLIGGVFAPALFFGAIAGAAYHDILLQSINFFSDIYSANQQMISDFSATAIAASISTPPSNPMISDEIEALINNGVNTITSNNHLSSSFFTIANAPAYATVGNLSVNYYLSMRCK